MAHHSSLKKFHTTVFLTPGIFPKKEPPKRLDLVQGKGLAVCCGCALHTDPSQNGTSFFAENIPHDCFLNARNLSKKRAAKATRFGAGEGTCRLLRLCLAF